MSEDVNMVALVTGAARGIGRAVALRLASMGYAVAINYSASADGAEELAQEIESSGGRAITLGFDVSQPGEVEAGFAALMEEFGRIDVLVNNAGIVRDGLLVRMKEEDWERVLAVNLKGAFLCIKAAARPMMKQRGGRIVNIGSVVGAMGSAGQVNYSASKAGEIALTKSLAKELGKFNVNVNAIAPGMVMTDMARSIPAEFLNKAIDETVLGRVATPEDVANVVAFFCSDKSRHITGECVKVDGGQYI